MAQRWGGVFVIGMRIDEGDLRRLFGALDRTPSPDAVEWGLGALAVQAQTTIIDKLPAVTGQARRSVRVDTKPTQAAVWSDLPYIYRWLELGTRDDPRAGVVHMRTRVGGYRAFEAGQAEVERGGAAILKGLASRIESDWGRA
jgi:hypothetical protein